MTKIEIWKPVPNFDAFEASSTGKVRRIRSCKGTPIQDITPRKGVDGYWRISIKQDGVRLCTTLHRLICQVFHGDPPSDRHCVSHLDGNKDNNSVSNLAWATYSENELQKRLHGCAQIGERNGAAKLSTDKVIAIRSANYSDRGSAAKLAKFFGVSPSVICHVRHYKTWNHV